MKCLPTKASQVFPVNPQEFAKLQEVLSKKLCLSLPDALAHKTIYFDASGNAMGAILAQHRGDLEEILGFFSKLFTETEQRYSTSERECLALVRALENWRHLIQGIPVTAITDHKPLISFMKHHSPVNSRLARWQLQA